MILKGKSFINTLTLATLASMLTAVLMPTPAFAADDKTAVKVELQKLVSGYNSFVTDFRNVTTTPKGKQLSASSGQLRIAKPNKILLYTKSPNELFVSVIGNNVEIYDPFIEVVKRGTKKDAQISSFTYLLNLASAANWNNISVTKTSTKALTCYKVYDPKIANIYSNMQVCAAGSIISQLSFTEKSGNVQNFYLSNLRSIALSDADFKIKYPESTKVQGLD